MDETTYSDPSVIQAVNKNFIPVRVDIDHRPDISERYNKGGFPTTVFLSDRGEPVWGATYIPPGNMIKVMKAILDAKESGEIEQALESGRLKYLDISMGAVKPASPDSEFVEAIFENIFSDYDVEFGGFGMDQKFPQPDAIDLLLRRYSKDLDQELSGAVENTLDKMAQGLFDKEEGGVFRYSVRRDWKEPHYEKMLETNLGFLRNTVHASIVLGKSRYADLARGTGRYLVDALWDKDEGGFRGSQDADEGYYRLNAGDRSRRKAPAVDSGVYAGSNAEAVRWMIEAGALLKDPSWVSAGKSAWDYSMKHLWDPEEKLVRHMKGQRLYLFEDQASFLRSLISVLEVDFDKDLLSIAESLVSRVDKSFASPEGGFADTMSTDDAIGELGSSRRPLTANAEWAEAIALLGAVTKRPGVTDRAWAILQSFSRRSVEAHGVSAASFISTWWTLAQGPISVEIHGVADEDPTSQPLWLAAKEALNPSAVTVLNRDEGMFLSLHEDPFAVVCTSVGCLKEITDPKELKQKLKPALASQI